MTAPDEPPEATTGTAIVPFSGDLAARAQGWAGLPEDELPRRAIEAARDRDTERLWGLAEAWLTTWGPAGGRVSAGTLRKYHEGVRVVVTAASGVNLLRPPRNWGAGWVRAFEVQGLAPSTVRQHLAAARALWAALRWAGATDSDPFADVKPAKDPTPAHAKRSPYPQEALDRLLEIADYRDTALLLLGAHAGLRVSEACTLTQADLDLPARQLQVRHGKGGKARTVSLSRRLCDVLAQVEVHEDGRLLGLSAQGARAALHRLEARAGVAPVKGRAMHALRHTAGTAVYKATEGRLEDVARHLGHAGLETARVYVAWSDERLRTAVEGL